MAFNKKEQVDLSVRPYFPEIDCFCQEHPWRNIVYICLKPECNIYPRIACPACLLQNHQAHVFDLIELKEVYLQTTGHVSNVNYPKDAVLNELQSFLKSTNKVVSNETIDRQLMDQLKEEVLESVEKVRECLKTKLKSHSEVYDSAVQELESLFRKAYSLEDVRVALDKYHDEKLKLDELNKEIDRFAKSEERSSIIKQALQRFNKLKSEVDTVFLDNAYTHIQRKILDDVDLIKLTIESLKSKTRIDDLFKRRDELPIWALDMVRPCRKDSVILRERDFDVINEWVGQKMVKVVLLFRGSRDGMNSKAFHQKCDSKGPTLVVCQSKNELQVFGGVCFSKWSSPSSGTYISDSRGFLYSLSNKSRYEIQDSDTAYYQQQSMGPSFGRGHDLLITNDFTKCSGKLGQSYHGSQDLAGQPVFDLKEMEVFQFEV